MKSFKIAIASVFFLLATYAQAGLITYTDRTIFDSAAPGLALEDFEVGTGAGGVSVVGAAVNSTTNAGNITPGEILPGINLTAISGGDMVSLGAGAAGITGLTSNGIAPNLFADFLRLDLAPAVTGVGFDLATSLAGALGTVDAQFFNGATLLGTLTVSVSNSALSFGGAIATGGDVITRVDFVNEIPGSQGVVMDNLAFGNPVPAPGALMLLCLGLVSFGYHQSRQTSRTSAI